jgi:hypothetical protein
VPGELGTVWVMPPGVVVLCSGKLPSGRPVLCSGVDGGKP